MFASTHNRITVSNTAYIFHSAILIIGAHHMINFSKRISCSEILLVKIESCLRHSKYHFVFQVFCETLAHKNPLRNVHRIVISVNFIRACTKSIQISADARSLLVFVKTTSITVLCNYIQIISGSLYIVEFYYVLAFVRYLLQGYYFIFKQF